MIQVSPSENQFISNIFLRPNKNGKLRPIINLKGLNLHLEKIHFKMEHLPSILPLISPGTLMTSIDLTDAYFSLPIAKKSRKYLRFQWRDMLLEFQCLCFGLSLAPYYFTKVMKPVFSQLRREGISCTFYLDDSLYLSRSYDEAKINTQRAITLLESLGFTINHAKSHLEPTVEITHLGFKINSVSQIISLPDEKVAKILTSCNELLTATRITIRQLAQTIGLLVSSFMAIKQGQLHYRSLEVHKTRSLQNTGSFDARITLDPPSRQELLWWQTHIKSNNGRKISDVIGISEYQLEIFTDASNSGWGAVLCFQGNTISETGGRWSQHETEMHINFLELKAVQFALFAFEARISRETVKINTDNTTAMSYINKYGGCHTPCLNNLSKEIWFWCIARNIHITAAHVPGIDNISADALSRNFIDNIEWSLDEKTFKSLCFIFDQPTVDLFASRLNNKLPRFFSWRPDPYSEAVNAFSQSWQNLYGYAFPPFNMIGKVLNKISREKCIVLLVCPFWPSQPWFPYLAELFVDFPIELPSFPSLLSCPGQPDVCHPLLPQMTLVACKLSTDNYLRTEFLSKLSTLSKQAGNQTHGKAMNQSLNNGLHFVMQGTAIFLRHLSTLS